MAEMRPQPRRQRAAEQEATDRGGIRANGIAELPEQGEVDGRQMLAQKGRHLLLADPFAQPLELLRGRHPLPWSERFAQHRGVEGLADDEQDQLRAAGGEVDPVFGLPGSFQQHALHRQMVVLDGGPGDGPVVDVEVDELAARVVQAVVIGDRRIAAAPGGPEARALHDRAETGCVASIHQEVQVGIATKSARQVAVALPVAIANAGPVQRVKDGTQHGKYSHSARRGSPRALRPGRGTFLGCRHRRSP